MQFIVHPGAEPWTPSGRDLGILDRRFPGPAYEAHLWPRGEVQRIHGAPSRPWAFRAFTRNGVSHLFADDTEHSASIAWLLAHELVHQDIAYHPAVKDYLVEARPDELVPATDAFHVVDPEERTADGVATHLLGTRYDRAWWRTRTPVSDRAPGSIRGVVFGGLFVGPTRHC